MKLKLIVAIVIVPLVGCTAPDEMKASIGSLSAAPSPVSCDFTHSGVDGTFCNVSIFGLIANPDSYYDRFVFTYGYLENQPRGAVLRTDSSRRIVQDPASCILIDKFSISEAISDKYIPQEGIFSAAVAGRFVPSPKGICAGILEHAVIVDAAREDVP